MEILILRSLLLYKNENIKLEIMKKFFFNYNIFINLKLFFELSIRNNRVFDT